MFYRTAESVSPKHPDKLCDRISDAILDAYFKEEDGTISILDYKTDYVEHPQMLVERYRAQLDYYALALQRMTGCKVKDRIIYSFHFRKEIRIPV